MIRLIFFISDHSKSRTRSTLTIHEINTPSSGSIALTSGSGNSGEDSNWNKSEPYHKFPKSSKGQPLSEFPFFDKSNKPADQYLIHLDQCPNELRDKLRTETNFSSQEISFSSAKGQNVIIKSKGLEKIHTRFLQK